MYKKEAAFRDTLALKLSSHGHAAKTEVPVCPQSRQRADLIGRVNNTEYTIEAKITGRSSRADQCIGQALRKASLMGGIPVVAFPSDVLLSIELVAGILAMNKTGIEVRLCNENNIVLHTSMSSQDWLRLCSRRDGDVIDWCLDNMTDKELINEQRKNGLGPY